MYFLPGTPIRKYNLPEGYSFSNYRCVADRDDWTLICRKGLVADSDGNAYDNAITAIKDIVPEEDMFFLDHNGLHIGTVTAFVYSASNVADVHMVSIREDYRGRGLSKFLNMKALEYLESKHPRLVQLTTDEWRKWAIKSYINAGFKPVDYDVGMEDRWTFVLKELGETGIDMLNDAGDYYKNLSV